MCFDASVKKHPGERNRKGAKLKKLARKGIPNELHNTKGGEDGSAPSADPLAYHPHLLKNLVWQG